MNRIARLTALVLLVALCVFALASCGVSSYEKKLDKAGYEVTALDKDELKEYNEEDKDYDYKGILFATNGTDAVYVMKLKNKTQAADVAKEQEGAMIKGMVTEVKGKVVFFGTEGGVKAAMGK